MMFFLEETLINTLVSLCITYTCISFPYLFIRFTERNSLLVKCGLGVLVGLASAYIFHEGIINHASLYSAIISPITFGFIFFGYPVLILGVITSTLFIFGNTSYYDVFSMVFFLCLIGFDLTKRRGMVFVIYSYSIAQSLNLISHVSALNDSGYWQLAIAKTGLSLAFLLLLYFAFGKLIDLSASKNYFKKASETDPLTGVSNRRSIDLYLKKVEESMNTQFCVFMLDIDNFKSINDNFGHPFGDTIISTVAKLIKKNIRSNDFVGRYGGEEFIIILNSSLDNALPVAEKMRVIIEEHVNEIDPQESVYVTVSVGVAEHSPGSPVNIAVANADSALYKAKTGGKNRVEVY
ncbi:GGDEF domain-containing protein [Rahnella inusitata]|uniref:GGDEF domain-containing protein n=1 Tax=Rahnella inusitata TaxID=58169 RepID=UPI0039AF0136